MHSGVFRTATSTGLLAAIIGVLVADAAAVQAVNGMSAPSRGRTVVSATRLQPAPTATPVTARVGSVSAHHRRHRRALTARHTVRAAAVARPSRVVATTVRHVAVRSPKPAAAVAGPTAWDALNAVILRIPASIGRVRWVVSDKYGYAGTTDWYNDTIYISPSVPSSYLFDVAVHEWSHELSVLDYGGDVDAAVKAMNAAFGGPGSTGLNGAENAADCMARLQGATWTHYTDCTDSTWRQQAAKLLAGQRL
jgi:hypothetical protein